MNTSALIQKVWNFCHTLKDDGVGYGDYLEQLTYLLFLKMAHEYTEPPYSRPTALPAGHGWPALRDKTGEPLIARADALLTERKRTFDYVLANPPFGKKSSMTFTNAEGEDDREALTYERRDFWTTTSNKQLNFLQHIVSMLGSHGKAAVVLPDNVLFEGGAGEKIRRKWLETCEVHTILRLPTRIFYAQRVKANVVFFDARPKDGAVQTQGVWFHDLRTNQHFTLKTRPLAYDDLRDFIDRYNPANRHLRQASERFRFLPYDELVARDKASLDVFWLKDNSLDSLSNLPPPDVLQQEIIDHLEAALAAFRDVAANLPRTAPVAGLPALPAA